MYMTRKYVGIAALCISGLFVAACGAGDEPPYEPINDAGLMLVVSGIADGVVEPVALRLQFSGGMETLTVTEDGSFTFTTLLRQGSLFNVEVTGEQTCVLENAGGSVRDSMPPVGVVCAGLLLADLSLSEPALAVVEVVPEQSRYAVDVSLLQQSVRVIATAMSQASTITVAGEAVTSGAPSEPLALDLGDNAIDVTVTHTSGSTRAYRLDVRRASPIAQHAYGKASNTGTLDSFGYSVALSGDTLAVGATEEDGSSRGVGGDQDDDGTTASGAVYVFRRNGAAWQQEAYIKASNGDAEDRFGWSVALSGDTLAVGALNEASSASGIDGDQGDNGSPRGAVYVFTRGAAGWQQEAYVKASNTSFSALFGMSVALSGNTLAVGALGDRSDARGVNGDQQNGNAPGSGAVYVFTRGDGGWRQEAYLKASNTGPSDFFGASVSLSGDTLAVGATYEDSGARGVNGDQEDESEAGSGAVYVFRRAGQTWQQEAYLKASNTDEDDGFGWSVSLSENLLAVGADREDSGARGIGGAQDDESSVESGAVYVFRRNGSTWQQEAYLKASNTGAGDGFGACVALAGDMLAVGAPSEDSAGGLEDDQDNESAQESGAVYLFGRSAAGWQQLSFVEGANTGASDQFGNAVALTEDTFVAGAYQEASAARGVGGDEDDDSALGSGAVYVLH
jgi:trimeric autotransporter adhesin